MNDPEVSLPQTIPPQPPPNDETPPVAGTSLDPHRTVDFPELPPTDITSELPHVPGFLLEKELARGGMGVVFQARDVAMNRTVAVKMLQDRYAPDSHVASRFLDEAQITGQLQHPGIPPIYHVGTLADGRPFLAMKLIKGETLDATIKRGERINYLALIEAIAQAVGYAHAHGVIHRDLKPPNIMVGAFGEVQVMDWGLAKVLTAGDEASAHRAVADKPLATTMYNPRTGTGSSETQAGSVLGTPAYMAPEQAAGEIDKIDARTDVFGLGGVLCVMLTGQPPFTGTDAESVRLQAVRGQTEAAFARLDGCGAEAEVIALGKRCLAFAPADRPVDGDAVAKEVAALRAAAEERAKQAEIERARVEVIAAEQHKRRQVWLGLAVTLLVGLLASSGLAAWALHAEGQTRTEREQAKTERDQKEEQRRVADTERKLAEAERKEAVVQRDAANEVKQFLQRDVLLLADPATQQADRIAERTFDADVRLREVVLRAAKTLDGKFSTQPLVEADLRGTIGYTLVGMGRADLAGTHLQRARTLYLQHRGPDHPDVLETMNSLAVSHYHLGRYAEALKLFGETLAGRKTVLGPDHPLTLMTMHNVALSYAILGRHTEALELYAQTLARWKATNRSNSRGALNCMQSLAEIYYTLGRHTEALALHEEVLTRRKDMLGPDHPDTLVSLAHVAESYKVLGRYAEVLKLYEEALARMKAVLGPDHPVTLKSMSSLAVSLAVLGRHAEALKLYEDALARMTATLGPDHLETLKCIQNQAISHNSLGQHAEAVKLLTKTLARMTATLGPDHPETLKCMYNLAISHDDLGQHADAIKLYRETSAIRERRAAADPQDLDNLMSLGGVQCNLGYDLCRQAKFAESLPVYGRAIEHLHAVLRQQPQAATAKEFLRNAHWGRVESYEQLQRYAEADADWAKAIDLTPPNQRAAVTKDRDQWKAKRKPPTTSGKP